MIRKLALFTLTWCIVIACDPSGMHHPSHLGKDSLNGHLTSDLVQNSRTLNGQANTQLKPAEISFEDTLHSFGKLNEGEIVSYEFNFTNTGESDLLITDTKTSCGCTTPEFPRQPLRAGETGTIKVSFNSTGKRGYNEKSVVVFSNAQPGTQELLIQAEVH